MPFAHLISDGDLERISEANPGWQIERADDGSLVARPTSTNGGFKSGEAFAQLYAYAKKAGGKVCDAGTGFKTPAGGVVSPDAAWISAARIAEHAQEDGYWQTMPDVAIEVASKTESWNRVTAKIDKYLSDGAGFALAIDPESGATYAAGEPPEGLALDVAAIVAA